MKIPKKVRIGPHVYKISQVKNLGNDHKALGQTVYERGEIKFDPDMIESQIMDTILHEILHAINDQVRFIPGEREAQEEAICRLSPSLLQVLQDNKELFKW